MAATSFDGGKMVTQKALHVKCSRTFSMASKSRRECHPERVHTANPVPSTEPVGLETLFLRMTSEGSLWRSLTRTGSFASLAREQGFELELFLTRYQVCGLNPLRMTLTPTLGSPAESPIAFDR